MKVLSVKPIITADGLLSTMTINELEPDKTLEGMYKIIGCRCVDVREVEIDGTVFDVWFDDEFLLSGEPQIPSLLLPYETVICGTVLFAKSNEDGETIGLNNDEIIKAADFANKSMIDAIRYVQKQLAS